MDTERKALIEIDVSGVTDHRGLQLLLMNSLDFPGWYGCNWNASHFGMRLRDWSKCQRCSVSSAGNSSLSDCQKMRELCESASKK